MQRKRGKNSGDKSRTVWAATYDGIKPQTLSPVVYPCCPYAQEMSSDQEDQITSILVNLCRLPHSRLTHYEWTRMAGKFLDEEDELSPLVFASIMRLALAAAISLAKSFWLFAPFAAVIAIAWILFDQQQIGAFPSEPWRTLASPKGKILANEQLSWFCCQLKGFQSMQ